MKRFTTSLINDKNFVTMGAAQAVATANATRRVHSKTITDPMDEVLRTAHANHGPSLNALPSRSSMPDPVMEGFGNSPSAHLAPIGGGYDNPNLVAARQRAPRSIASRMGESTLSNFSGFRKSGMHDYRYNSRRSF